MIRQGART